MEHEVELLHTRFITPDVRQYVITRPRDLEFEPGQGVEIALDQDGWRDEGRPFTPTSLPDEPVLEFTIKSYPEHEGMTERLHRLEPGARLHMSEPFGTIQWRGPGTFLAGGAGVTPFLAILRDRYRAGELGDSRLYFSNSTPADVICERELRYLLGDRCHLSCTAESAPGYDDRRFDRDFLADEIRDRSGLFYVCGPPGFVESVSESLKALGAEPDQIVLEE
jgi:ferredoxin-NADP reductase